MSDGDTVIQVTFIVIIIFASINLILSILQLTNKNDYGYKGILSMIEENQIILSIKESECDEYVSDINSKKNFAEIKTLIILIINALKIIHASVRLKNVEKGCKIGILFLVMFIVGFFCELIIASMNLDFFNKTKYTSYNFEKCNKFEDALLINEDIFDGAKSAYKWVIKIDKAIISFICFSLLPLMVNSCFLMIEYDSKAKNWVNEEVCWLCLCLRDCFCVYFCESCSKCCESIGDCCSNCCNNFGKCCSKCCGNDETSLKEENSTLKSEIRNLKNEIKTQNNQKENYLITERKKFESELLLLKNKNYDNSEEKKLLDNEINNLKKKNNNLENELRQLRNEKNNLISAKKNLEEEISSFMNKNFDNSKEIESLRKENDNLKLELNQIKNLNRIINEEKNNLEKKLLSKKIEEKQKQVIDYYLYSKGMLKKLNEKVFSPNIIFLEEIYNNFGLFIDSKKFSEIALYYIKSKLTENLRDPNNSKIFSNPMISEDGKTFEENNIIDIEDMNYGMEKVENKLAFKLCEILRKREDNLDMEDFNNIKKLLRNGKGNEYFKNPVVITNGRYKGETIEGNNSNNYKNLVIKKIINDIRELLEDDFFKFEGIKTRERKGVNNKFELIF